MRGLVSLNEVFEGHVFSGLHLYTILQTLMTSKAMQLIYF